MSYDNAQQATVTVAFDMQTAQEVCYVIWCTVSDESLFDLTDKEQAAARSRLTAAAMNIMAAAGVLPPMPDGVSSTGKRGQQ